MEKTATVVKLAILFKHPSNAEQFEVDYVQNLALLEKLPGIIKRQANVVLGTPMGKSPYCRALELYFDSFEALDAAMTSPAGKNAGQQLMKSVGNLVEIMFTDVFEDDTALGEA